MNHVGRIQSRLFVIPQSSPYVATKVSINFLGSNKPNPTRSYTESKGKVRSTRFGKTELQHLGGKQGTFWLDFKGLDFKGLDFKGKPPLRRMRKKGKRGEA